MNQSQSLVKITKNQISWRNGKNWFAQGVDSFKQVKNFWYLSCLLLIVAMALLINLSVSFVTVAVIFASPVITAFMMNCCFQVEQQKPMSFVQTWQQVLKPLNSFLILGMISAALSLIMQQIYLQLMSWLNLPIELTQEMVKNMTGKEAFIRAVLNLMTNIPLALALVFSPALILFNKSQPIHAIKFSVLGVIHAWKAFVSFVLLVTITLFAIILMASFLTSLFVVVFGGNGQLLLNVMVLFLVFTITGIILCGQYHAYSEIFENNSKNDDEIEIYAEI